MSASNNVSTKFFRSLLIFIFAATAVWLASDYLRTYFKGAPVPLNVDGSTTISQAFSDILDRYSTSHPGFTYLSRDSGSSEGIKRLIMGEIQIARASVYPEPEDFKQAQQRGLTLVVDKIAYDALAIVVHPERAKGLTGMNFAELRKIFFEGSIDDWSILNPAISGRLDVIIRDPISSGTFSWLEKKLNVPANHAISAKTQVLKSPTLMRERVRGNPASITFLPYGYVDGSVTPLAVAVDQEPPVPYTLQNIINGSYPLVRPTFLITTNKSTQEIREILEFTLSSAGQSVLSTHGLLPISAIQSN